jgi:sulfite oxidase
MKDHILNDWYTPNDDFFIRNHYPVPIINEKDYTLTIDGIGVKKTVFTLEDLKTKFRKHEVTSSIMCGGNRRGGLN